MKLRGYGEDRLVAELTQALALGKDVRVGVGDDCAVIGAPKARRWQLLKTDVVVEGVHFLSEEKPARVGWKALCRAISDIAAMGGLPEHALVTLAVAPTAEVAEIKALYAGLQKAAEQFGVSIVGGETARSPGPLFLNIALTGSVERTRCVLRSGARTGDAIYVTGTLGGSRAGKHLDFLPRVAEARWLGSHFLPTAMMDLSDGLAADLPRLARASGCSFTLEQERIPRTHGSSLENALQDGEDFELLFTVPAQTPARLEPAWAKAFPQLPLTRIGCITPSTSNALSTSLGFDHFA